MSTMLLAAVLLSAAPKDDPFPEFGKLYRTTEKHGPLIKDGKLVFELPFDRKDEKYKPRAGESMQWYRKSNTEAGLWYIRREKLYKDGEPLSKAPTADDFKAADKEAEAKAKARGVLGQVK